MASHSNYSTANHQKRADIYKQRRNLNKNMDNMTKSDKLMTGIGLWTSFYRLFPHIFVREYLGINLKVFQMIILYMFMHQNYSMYLASRGQGKTFLTSIFIICRSILFPETKIIIAAGNVKQSIEVIEKIQDMMGNSPNLAREIEDIKTSPNNAGIIFRNGSRVSVVASNDGARGKRANLVIVDEFRMVKALTTYLEIGMKKYSVNFGKSKWINCWHYKTDLAIMLMRDKLGVINLIESGVPKPFLSSF